MKKGRIFQGFFLFLSGWIFLLGGCRTRPAFDFGAYTEAAGLYEKGEYEKAIQKYEAYLRENPEGNLAVISQYYMGKSYEGLGRVAEARGLYRKIVKEHPNLIWADFSRTRLEELGRERS